MATKSHKETQKWEEARGQKTWHKRPRLCPGRERLTGNPLQRSSQTGKLEEGSEYG